MKRSMMFMNEAIGASGMNSSFLHMISAFSANTSGKCGGQLTENDTAGIKIHMNLNIYWKWLKKPYIDIQ